MRIAFLSAACSIHTVRWVNALADRGHEIALFSLLRHADKMGSISQKITVYYLRGGYLSATQAFSRELAAFSPQVLNAHYATGYGTLARRSRFNPLLLSIWGSDIYDFPHFGPIHRHIVVKNLRAADAIASTSQRMADRARLLYAHENIFITPFGVDTHLFSPSMKRTPKNTVTIGIVKALEPKYGVEFLLRAFALLVARLPAINLQLIFCGSGSQEDKLKRISKKLEIEDRVRFLGAVSHREVPNVLRKFDIFCVPSVLDSESFGVAAVEAMACALPVVAGAVDGFKEVMQDGQTGYLAIPESVTDLADKLEKLVVSPDLREQMGAAGRKNVMQRFEWDRCVTKMEQVLEKTAQRKGADS